MIDFTKDYESPTYLGTGKRNIKGQECPRFNDIIGFQEAKAYLSTCIHAADLRSTRMEHVLVLGPSYIDKQSFALAIAGEISKNGDQNVAVYDNSFIMSQGDLAAVLTNLNGNDILVINGVEKLKKPVVEVLSQALSSFSVTVPIGKGINADSVQFDFPGFTLIGICSRVEKLPATLRQAFGVTVKMKSYTTDSMIQLLKSKVKPKDIPQDHDAYIVIADQSGGNPIRAEMLYRRIQDYAIVTGVVQISAPFAKECLSHIKQAERNS